MAQPKDRKVPKPLVEKELGKILASSRFGGGAYSKGAERGSELLTYLVGKVLANEPVKDTTILLEFYGKTPAEVKEDPTVARKAVGRLRERLTDYFENEGLSDTVLIEIPKFQCNIVFGWKDDSAAAKELRLGLHHVDRETDEDIRLAIQHFDTAIALEPEFADAHAGKASAKITLCLHEVDRDSRPFLEEALKDAEEAIKFDETSWLGHANLGLVLLFRHKWSQADEEFDKAYELNAAALSEISGYGPYLFSRGRIEDGHALASAYEIDGYLEPVFLVRAGLYFYVRRDFEAAKRVLKRALELDRFFWRAHITLAFVGLATDDPEIALKHMDLAQELAEKKLWPGLKIVCLEMTGRVQDSIEDYNALKRLSETGYVRPHQLALGAMAQGESAAAVSLLSQACDEFDPFAAWLHLWPVLDPLRKAPEFRQLLHKWRFPLTR